MKQRLLFIVCALPVLLQAQNFFDQTVIQEIKLTFFQTNGDAKLDSLKSANEEVYLLAKSVEVNGELFDSVGVKYKGNSAYNTTGIFSPQRAEHEFYTATAFPPPPNVGDLVINEFLADNADGTTDEAGQLEDWVELYNNTTNAIDLTGLYLTDDAANAAKWPFPAGVSMPGNSYLIVWLDEDGMQGPLHANFKLKAAGEFVMLSNGGSTVLDSLSFGQQLPDISFGRFPNGTGPFTYMPTTFAANNSLQSSTNAPGNPDFVQIFPNPFTDLLTIQSSMPLANIQVFNTLGQSVATVNPDNRNEVILDLQNLPSGLYFAHCTAENGIIQGINVAKH